MNGGSVWESNPPCPFVTGNTGFEVQEGHQNPMHSLMIKYNIVKVATGRVLHFCSFSVETTSEVVVSTKSAQIPYPACI